MALFDIKLGWCLVDWILTEKMFLHFAAGGGGGGGVLTAHVISFLG